MFATLLPPRIHGGSSMPCCPAVSRQQCSSVPRASEGLGQRRRRRPTAPPKLPAALGHLPPSTAAALMRSADVIDHYERLRARRMSDGSDSSDDDDSDMRQDDSGTRVGSRCSSRCSSRGSSHSRSSSRGSVRRSMGRGSISLSDVGAGVGAVDPHCYRRLGRTPLGSTTASRIAGGSITVGAGAMSGSGGTQVATELSRLGGVIQPHELLALTALAGSEFVTPEQLAAKAARRRNFQKNVRGAAMSAGWLGGHREAKKKEQMRKFLHGIQSRAHVSMMHVRAREETTRFFGA